MSDYLAAVEARSLRKALAEMERRLARVEQRMLRGIGSVDEVAEDLGEVIGGGDIDSLGSELVVNGNFSTGDSTGWGDSIGVLDWNGSITSFSNSPVTAISDRFAVNENWIIRFACDGAHPYPGVIQRITIEWYDALSGGNLILTDSVPFAPEEPAYSGLHQIILRAPEGAAAARWNAYQYHLPFASFDNFSARVVSFSNRLTLDPLPVITVEGNQRRITAGALAFANPAVLGAPTASLVLDGGSGNLTVGESYSYVVTYLDGEGETLFGYPSVAVVPDATHRQTLVNLPYPLPTGIIGARIYRNKTGVDGYWLVATVGNLGTAPYQDNIADVNLGAAPPEENTTLMRPVLPTFHSQMFNSVRSNFTITRTAAGADQTHGEFFVASTQANGNWFEFDVYLEQGVYDLKTLGVRSTGRGKLDWYLDGKLVYSGQDWRHPSSVGYGYIMTFALTLPEPGHHTIRGVVNGTSGSGYGLGITEIWLTRTGR